MSRISETTAATKAKKGTSTGKGLVKRIWNFYINGLRSMTLGKTLWKIILIKLAVIFLVIKLFFFPDVMKTHFSSDQQRSQHVLNVLTGQAKK